MKTQTPTELNQEQTQKQTNTNKDFIKAKDGLQPTRQPSYRISFATSL